MLETLPNCQGVSGCKNAPVIAINDDGEKMCEPCHQRIMGSLSKPEDCQSCGWATKKLKSYPKDKLNETNQREQWWLCQVCAGTFVGTSSKYVYDDVMIQRSLALATNMILQKLAKAESDNKILLKRVEKLEDLMHNISHNLAQRPLS